MSSKPTPMSLPPVGAAVVKDPKTGGSFALTPLGVNGGRKGKGKLAFVTKKTARRLLKKLGKKMRGGGDEPVATPTTPATEASTKSALSDLLPGATGGRRTRRRKSRGRSRMFGF